MAGRLLHERVTDLSRRSPGGAKAELPFGVNHMKVAEAEFAFRMGRDLAPRTQPYSVEEALDAVATLHPAIEVPDSRFDDFTIVGAPQLIADNACAHLFILGPPAPDAARHPYTTAEKRTLAVLALAAGLWLTDSLHQLSPAIPALLGAAILLLPGVGVISWKTFESRLSWGLVLTVGTSLSLATLMTTTGAAAWLGQLLLGHLSALAAVPLLLMATLIVAAVLVPRPKTAAASHFLKLGARRYLVISIAMASAVLEHKAGKVQAARVAVGACSPVAVRLPALEADLRGQRFDATLADRVQVRHFAALAPIADVRASAEYRVQAALELVRRLLREMA